jgi:hypothetical protein
LSAWVRRCQGRTFSSDNRGFLAWEGHPEKGSSCNGYVRYLEYDARGNVGRKLDAVATASATIGAAIDVRFTYDRAARLTQVTEAAGSFRPLKAFTYATANSGGNRMLGKLRTRLHRHHALHRADAGDRRLRRDRREGQPAGTGGGAARR